MLTFDEFLSIPPCTTGCHSTAVQETAEKPSIQSDIIIPTPGKPSATLIDTPSERISSVGVAQPPDRQAVTSVSPESESDEPSLPIPPNRSCRRRGCKAFSQPGLDPRRRAEERCRYHSGQPIFHEGSKGWTCCKRRVLEFDEFMRIEGCQRKERHLFVGSGKSAGKEKLISDVR